MYAIRSYYDCKQHVYELSKIFYNDKEATTFVDQVMECLTNKEVEKGIDKIRLLGSDTKTKQVAKEKLLNYLNTNKKRIDYGNFKDKGLLIGSVV